MKRFIVTVVAIPLLTVGAFAQGIDYGGALDAAIKFFDANRCGPDAGKDNAFSWRGACHTGDAVTGGYHDAGDHVKFGLPQCWSAAIMGWAYYEYPSVFEPRKDKFFKMMKWFTDYFLKCHSPGSFIHTIGNGNEDHGFWDSPEKQGNGPRQVEKAPPGSDVCGEAAAALALMYLNYKSIDESYAQQCLEAAKDLHSMAVANADGANARCSDGAGGNFYKSSSHYDDVVWASIWLYYATGDAKYLEKTDEWILVKNDYNNDPFKKEWAPAWDDVTVFNLVKLAEITGNGTYYDGVVYNLEWFRDKPKMGFSPGGLPLIDSWAPLRYASCEAGLGFSAWRLLGYDGFNKMGTFIIDYCLGKNPESRSYLTGWGNNPPKHPHHRANEPQRGGATNGIIGALVGGPTDDSYEDNVNNYTETEVALDYNASFIYGLAAYMYYAGGGKCKNRSPSVKIASPLNGIAVPEGASMEVKVVAEDADGKVTNIELYQGDKLLGSSPTSPFLFKLENPGTGEVSLKAVATDDSGKVSNASVTITYIPPCKSGEMLVHTGWVASASSSSPNAGEDPSSALDGKPDTRWGSGGAMSQGMWYQIDMGFPRLVDQLTVDATGSGSDFPKRLNVYATNDTAALGAPVATIDSGTSLQSITFTYPVTAQIIRLVCEEGQGGSWWSIHEICIPCAGSAAVQYKTGPRKDNSGFQFDALTHGRSILVSYNIPQSGRVTIEEYLLNGTRANILFDGIRNAGNYSFTHNITRAGSKMAFLKIKYNGASQLKRVILTH